MAKILSFGKDSQKRKGKFFETVWEPLQSMSAFGKFFLLTAVLIIVATPFIAANKQIFNPHAATGKTLVVGIGGYSNIQSAVNSALDGDTISVKAGTYSEAISINKPITLSAYGDGPVLIDEKCQGGDGITIRANSVTIKGLTVKNTVGASIHVDGDASIQPNNLIIDGNTLTDFDCAWSSPNGSGAPSSWGQYRSGVAVWYGGSHITITNNRFEHRVGKIGLAAKGSADAIWFKSTDNTPSGGGHYIANNTIIGGWDGIGGEAEGDIHGSLDKDSIVENNKVTDCWDDGIQSEGGDQNIYIRNNNISGCGDGIAFAPPVTGPLYVQNNYIHNLSEGLYQNLFCFKVGDSSTATVYLTGNRCIVNTPSEVTAAGDESVGIMQTNSGLYPIVSSGNIFQTNGYVFYLVEWPRPSGEAFDGDCMHSNDSSRFAKWSNSSGSVVYSSLSQFQTGTGQEQNGKQTADCSFLPITSPTPTSATTATPTSSSTSAPSPSVVPITQPAGNDTQSPTISITAPVNGAIVARNSKIIIQAGASDNVAVAHVDFLVNSNIICSDTTASYSCNWKTSGKRNATYTLTAKAYDTSGNTASVSIIVRSRN